MMSAGRILVTGATGFVGRVLVRQAYARGVPIRAAVRRLDSSPIGEQVLVGGVDGETEWSEAVRDCDVAVHLANLAHTPASTAELERVNVTGTLRLAQQACEHGVRRVVFLSSIKALGDETLDRALEEGDVPAPRDAYGQAKLEAERGLWQLAKRTGLEVAILRPPLVYGPGVKANFRALLGAIERGLPLPLASIENRRSLVYVGNLADAILACAIAPAAAGRTYHVTDGPAISTPSLVRAFAAGLARPARLFPFPPRLLELLAQCFGRGATARRLTRSLEVSDLAIRRELGWRPKFTYEEGIRETATWYLERALRGSR